MFKLAIAAFVAAPLAMPAISFANHAVLIEGETDFDGDNLIGAAEDADGDAVFGKISTALAAGNGLNQNGKAIIVTSGRFPEVVNITGPTTLEAAPGVEADIEAFLAPAADPARLRDFDTPTTNNVSRQNAPGIIINAPADRPVVIRNVTVRNWTDGIRVLGGNVLLDNVRIEHNTMVGIAVSGSAQVAIVNSSVASSGFRVSPSTMTDFPRTNASPGIGVRFTGTSTGDIQRSSLTNNFGSGLSIETPRVRDVTIRDVQIFGNNFGNPNAANLINLCRMSSNRNFDEADVCFQAVQRSVLQIPEQP